MFGMYRWNDLRALPLLILTLVVMVLLLSCAASNPVAAAKTSEQKAFALYGSFVIFQEKAADLVESGALSNSVIIKIANAEERAKPVADSLADASEEFAAIRKEYEEGGETDEFRLVAAINNLDAWVTRAAPLIHNFVDAVQGETE